MIKEKFIVKLKFLLSGAILILSLPFVMAQETYQNPIINKYLADPFIMFDNGYYYLFATGIADDGKGVIIYRSKNLSIWEYRNGAVTRGKRTDWNYKHFWAPEVMKFSNKYYLYYTATSDTSYKNTGNRIGVAVADNIEGPYADSGVVVNHGAIDGHVVKENDSSMYIFFTIEHGNSMGLKAGRIYADKMTSNLRTLGKPFPIITSHKWQEGPCILYRNNTYFLTYSCGAWTNETYHLRFATSTKLAGPYVESKDTILKSNTMVKGPGHHAFFKDKCGNDWIVYHGWDTAFKARYPRIDRMQIIGNNILIESPSYLPIKFKCIIDSIR